MTKRIAALLIVFGLVAAGCKTGTKTPANGARVWEGLGTHHRAVTTKSPEAQKYFDQGLTWAYSFNHDEAIRSFQAAAELDPNCAMAYWGIALCNGPHINNPAMSREQSERAWAAIQKAVALAPGKGTLPQSSTRKYITKAESSRVQDVGIERALILALAARYSADMPTDRKALDQAYADAMHEVNFFFHDDADVLTLYAEAMMDLQPWNYWEKDGKAKGNAETIVKVLEEAMKLDPKHPGAVHYYIHAVEASTDPGRAVTAAETLRKLVPASGHMVHMPTHIDIRVGNWKMAQEGNEAAIVADGRYRAVAPKLGFYRVYMLHNRDFLTFAEMMRGRSKEALEAARAMVASVPPDVLKENPAMVDPYLDVVFEAKMRFGKWDEIINGQPPPGSAKQLPITTAMWRFSRGVAYAAEGKLREARDEQVEFERVRYDLPEGTMMAINKAEKILAIASNVLMGEIAFADGRLEEAVEKLEKGVQLEDELLYMEPPEWLIPVRHTLGAVLLSVGTPAADAKAEAVYREDLKRWPENGWALLGLKKSLEAQGKGEEAKKVGERLDVVWKDADEGIRTTCLCVPGK